MSRAGNRRHARAIQRQDAGYPEPLALNVRTVTLGEWASQFEAAEQLHISQLRLGSLVSAGTLEPVHDPAGRAGVSRESLDRERQLRSQGGALARLKYAVTDFLKAIANGI